MKLPTIFRQSLTPVVFVALVLGSPGSFGFSPRAQAAGSSASERLVQKLKAQIKILQKQLALERAPAPPPFIEMVPVGHPGNPADPEDGDGVSDGVQNFGAVPYEYQIGKYEVTLEQYTVFLNAVAATDTYSLYSANMATDQNVAGIQRFGSSGSFTYAVIGSGRRPVSYVSWFDAARFCNWLHHGRPSGPQTAATTEMGAYALNGATDGVLFFRNPGAKFWIPSEDEWYKAAFHRPQSQGGPSDHYYTYPTASDTVPGNAIGALLNQANYRTPNGFFSVTQSDSSSLTSDYLANGGAYSGSASYYGTFDQGGSLWERVDTILTENLRALRGGSWTSNETHLRWYARAPIAPTGEFNDVGFRVAGP
jgi:formylglycine-generating enzyme